MSKAELAAEVQAYVTAVKRLLAENGDSALLPAVVEQLKSEAAKQSSRPTVISAIELTDEQKITLQEVLETNEVDWQIDTSIGGGLILEENGLRTDLSLKKRLTNDR